MAHPWSTNDNQNGPYDYESLRGYIAEGVQPANKTYIYQNANFALFRMIIPYLWKGSFKLLDPDSYTEKLAEMYVEYVSEHVLKPMGIFDAGCKPAGSAQTLFYQFGEDTSGWNPSDWTLICGGGGWNMWARELAAFLAHLRYGNVLSAATRQQVDDERLGWKVKVGDHGDYLTHGDDLWDANSCTRGMTGAIMDFPNNV
ncbi:serine hydrolase domain-containing protein [Meiothermus sp.]|uniref:serine hydrolase domain-containing protein n=1 Tax=Meiothermus sp. TaxID=1955249 RepID=UPI00307ECED7